MEFERLPELDDAEFALRPIRREDLPAWYGYLSIPAVHEHTSWNVRSADDLAGYVWGAESSTPSSRVRLAIARRSDDALVGTAGFHSVAPEDRRAEIAYDLAPSVWGRGLATRVCGRLTEWAHRDPELARVQATVLVSNARSMRVLERCAFVREGVLRRYRWVRGRPGDFVLYAHVEG